jgi:N-acetylmuramoyl-L-alanine amidase
MKVLVSAGHSDVDPGALTKKYVEADLAKDMRNAIASKLSDRGIDVVTDGEEDENFGLKYAISLIMDCDVAIEIHFNASTNKSATGVEVVALPKDKELAQDFAKVIADITDQRLRGDGGYIPQEKTARGRAGFVSNGGLIIEMCFLTNEADMQKYLENFDAIAEGICDVIGSV